jgi:hypothetical protein
MRASCLRQLPDSRLPQTLAFQTLWLRRIGALQIAAELCQLNLNHGFGERNTKRWDARQGRVG